MNIDESRKLRIKEENKRIIEGFKVWAENEYGGDWSDYGPDENNELPVAYTTYSLSDAEEYCGIEHDIQITFDLDKRCYFDYVDGILINTEYRSEFSCDQILDEIDRCSFDDMIRECVRAGFERAERMERDMWKEILELYIPDDYHSIDTTYVGVEGYCVIAEYDAENCEVKTYYGDSWKQAFQHSGYYFGLLDMSIEDIEDMFEEDLSYLIKYEKHVQEKGLEEDGCITI